MAIGNYFAALPVRVPGDWFAQLRNGAADGLRWFHPDDLHLTLAFFGKEIPERISDVREVLGAIPFPGMEVSLGPLRPLPGARRFSALSFELENGRRTVAELISAWRGPLCEAAGVEADQRPPLPHLTVARPQRRELPRHRRRILDWVAEVTPPAEPVRVLPPVLYGWSEERPKRQFRVIE